MKTKLIRTDHDKDDMRNKTDAIIEQKLEHWRKLNDWLRRHR